MFVLRSAAYAQQILAVVHSTLEVLRAATSIKMVELLKELVICWEDIQSMFLRARSLNRQLSTALELRAPTPLVVQVLCSLDRMYFHMYYYWRTAPRAWAGYVVVDPACYLHWVAESASLRLERRNRFLAQMESLKQKKMVTKLLQESYELTDPIDETEAVEWPGPNPLHEVFALRFDETLALFADGSHHEFPVASTPSLTSSASSSKYSKKKQKRRKKHKSAVSSGLSDAPCSALLQEWRDNCRDWACHLYAYAVPSKNSLQTLKALGPLVEIGAGTGYWASLLQKMGVDIVAYDKLPTSMAASRRKFVATLAATQDSSADVASTSSAASAPSRDVNEYHRDVPAFTKVLRGDHNAAALFADRVLFLCYPPPNDPMALECLQVYKGDTVAYVGEWIGQTASRAFEAELRKHFHCTQLVDLPNFTNTIYQLSVWKRTNDAMLQAGEEGESICMCCCSVCGEVRGQKHIFTHQPAEYFENPDHVATELDSPLASGSSSKKKKKKKSNKSNKKNAAKGKEESTTSTEQEDRRRRHRILARVGPIRRCRFTRRRIYCSQECVEKDHSVRQAWLALSGFSVCPSEQSAVSKSAPPAFLDGAQFEVVREE